MKHVKNVKKRDNNKKNVCYLSKILHKKIYAFRSNRSMCIWVFFMAHPVDSILNRRCNGMKGLTVRRSVESVGVGLDRRVVSSTRHNELISDRRTDGQTETCQTQRVISRLHVAAPSTRPNFINRPSQPCTSMKRFVAPLGERMPIVIFFCVINV